MIGVKRTYFEKVAKAPDGTYSKERWESPLPREQFPWVLERVFGNRAAQQELQRLKVH